MKKWLCDEMVQKKILTYSLSGIIILCFFFFVSEFDAVATAIKNLLSILSPFIWGVTFAFFLIPLANRIDKFFPLRKRPNLRNTLIAIICIIFLILVIALFFAILIPQLVISISQLSEVFKGYIDNATAWINDFSELIALSDETINDIYTFASELVSRLIVWAQGYLPSLVQTIISSFTGIGNFVIGIIVALYIIIDREHLKRQLSRLSQAVFSTRHHRRFAMLVHLAIEKFSHFFIGKVIDSIIIGILTFITMTVLKLDYAILISFIVGVTNIIPFFGPFIGAIPSIFILLIVDPLQALIFAVAILVIQQLDGNLIGPTILGDSMGLSSLWIMFAIIVGGAYFGVLGMIVGVPVFAIIYFLIKEFVDNRLNDKGLETESENKE